MRLVLLALIVPLGCLGALACSKKPVQESRPDASASAVASSDAPAPARQAEPPPPDIDTADLAEDLGCSAKASGEVCRIVSEFSSGQKWKPSMPSGRGIWVGKVHRLGKEPGEGQLLALRAKTMPTSQVGPSDLPLMVGFEPLPQDYEAPGEKLVRALQQGGQGKLSNPVLPFLEERFMPRAEYGAMQSKGVSVRLISNDTILIRSISIKKIILIGIEAAGPSGDQISGQVAELWSAVW